jgi:molybdopterin-binding protein
MPFLTVRQAAARFGVSYSTLKQWIYQGSVRTTKTRGGHHRILPAEIDRVLAEQGALPPRPPERRSPADTPRIVALSTRNQLRGIVEEVRSDGILAQVRLRIGDDLLTAVITRDAALSLGLRRGMPAVALIKATEVMVGTEPSPPARRSRRRR